MAFDSTEFNLLRTITLLKGRVPQIHQLSVHFILAHHQQTHSPSQPLRYALTMRLLELLLSVDNSLLAELMENGKRTGKQAGQGDDSSVAVDTETSPKEVEAQQGALRVGSRGINPRKRLHPFSVDRLIEESVDERYTI